MLQTNRPAAYKTYRRTDLQRTKLAHMSQSYNVQLFVKTAKQLHQIRAAPISKGPHQANTFLPPPCRGFPSCIDTNIKIFLVFIFRKSLFKEFILPTKYFVSIAKRISHCPKLFATFMSTITV